MRRKLISIILILASFVFLSAKSRTFTDDAGRTREIPAKVKKVFSTSPIGTYFIYSLNEKKLGGLNTKISANEKLYLSQYYQNLPLLGGDFGKDNKTNCEAVIQVGCDLAISMGDVSDFYVSAADRLEKKLGIPVILLDGSLMSIPQTYKKLGELLGEEKRAKILADYTQDLLDRTKKIVAKIPENEKIRVYYAEGNEGLETDPEGSLHTEVLRFVGGINVAKVKKMKGYGRATVSMEQIMNWNPEMIIVCIDQGFNSDGDFYSKIYSNSLWEKVKAVENKQVYKIPYKPFNFCDRPPSINRISGIVWLSNLLYPKYFNYDVKAEVKKIYKLFYHKMLSDDEIDEILLGSERK